MKQQEDVIIIGASGHGKVIADIVLKSGDDLLGFLDDDPAAGKEIMGFPLLGTVGDAEKYATKAKFIIGIGSNHIRKQIAEKYNLNWHTAIHPSAVIATDVEVGEGTAVMANAVINPSTKIGRHCIINTGAIIEHDSSIADYAHISPNAATGGTVSIGECSHIGIGAAVKNNISVCAGCVIAAGAVVVKDIAEGGTYIGVPAGKV